LPPTVSGTDKCIASIAQSLAVGKMRCWCFGQERDGQEAQLRMVILTRVNYNDIAEEPYLEIFSLWSMNNMDKIPQSMYVDAHRAINGYAHGLGIKFIIAHTQVSAVVEMVRSLGGEASYTLIRLEVNDDAERNAWQDIREVGGLEGEESSAEQGVPEGDDVARREATDSGPVQAAATSEVHGVVREQVEAGVAGTGEGSGSGGEGSDNQGDDTSGCGDADGCAAAGGGGNGRERSLDTAGVVR